MDEERMVMVSALCSIQCNDTDDRVMGRTFGP